MKLQAIAILLFGFCLTLNAQQSNGDVMDWEKYDPPSTLVVPEHPTTRAKFPFVDVHSHHWRGLDRAYFEKLAKEMDELHMQAMINLSGGTGLSLKNMVDSAQRYIPGRFIVFANIELRSIDDPEFTASTVTQLENDHRNGARGLKIYKSQGMDNKDSKGNRIAINDPRLDPVWEKCGELGMPVLIHSADPAPFWQPWDEQNERWLELKVRSGRRRADFEASWEQIISEQHDIFRKHPNTTFINAHLGWFANNLDTLAQLLDAMPNMYTEIGAVIAELGRQPRAAKAFLIKYQDRVLFGKDSYNPEEYHTYFRVLETADEYFPYYKRYHAFWRMYGLDLPDEVLEKLYYKNALKIIPGLDPDQYPQTN